MTLHEAQIKAVLFDFDGVLIDSEPIIFEATRQLFAAFGVDLQRCDIESGIGAGAKYVEDPMLRYNLRDVSLDDLLKRREANFRRLAPGWLRTKPGVEVLLEQLKRRGLLTAVASSAETEVVLHNMALVGLDPALFDLVVDGSAVPAKKPAPDLFLEAARGLHCRPAECVVVEDALPGIEAARRAGMRCLALAGSFPPESLGHADRVVTGLDEVEQALGQLTRS